MDKSKFSQIQEIWCKFAREILLPEEIKTALEEAVPNANGKPEIRKNDFRIIAKILKYRKSYSGDGDIRRIINMGAFDNYEYNTWLELQNDLLTTLGTTTGNTKSHSSSRETTLIGAMEDFIEGFDLNENIKSEYLQKIKEVEDSFIHLRFPEQDNQIIKIPAEQKCPNNEEAKEFWKTYFPYIDKYNLNSISKGTNSNHRNAYWATVAKSKLKKDWYVIGTNTTQKVSKIFHIKPNTFYDEQFDIDWKITRKSKMPDKEKQFEICIDDNNYLEQIKKEADFSNSLRAIADFNTMQITLIKE